MGASLNEKVVIVTGSAGGLGKAIAQAYLAAGAKVVIADINNERLAATSTEWQAHVDAGVLHAVRTDVSNEASVADLIAQTVSKFGRLDVLVNNAGIMDHFDPVGTCTKEMWDRVLAVNLTGPFLATKAAVNQILAQDDADVATGGPDTRRKGGLIIMIGSNAGSYGMLSGVAYTTTKHGVSAITKNTAGFYADRNIACVEFLLGAMTDTNIADAFATGMNQDGYLRTTGAQPQLKGDLASIPLERVARYCLFLTEPGIATTANGSCITFSNNWPPA